MATLVQQILQAGADPEKVREALFSKTSPLVKDHNAMLKAMNIVGGKKDELDREMVLSGTFETDYPEDLGDSLASGWTIHIPKNCEKK